MKSLQVCLLAAAVTAGLSLAPAASANGPHEVPIREFAETTVKAWISDPFVIKAIKRQNAKHAGISQNDIIAMDKKWRAETRATKRPMIKSVLANDLSQFLIEASKQQGGVVTEIFIMDNRGLNVGQSAVTSDFWQGDEAKWKKTYLVGPDAMLIDEVELDESTQTFQSQLSMSITDPASGKVIGAITIGLDVELVVMANLESMTR